MKITMKSNKKSDPAPGQPKINEGVVVAFVFLIGIFIIGSFILYGIYSDRQVQKNIDFIKKNIIEPIKKEKNLEENWMGHWNLLAKYLLKNDYPETIIELLVKEGIPNSEIIIENIFLTYIAPEKQSAYTRRVVSDYFLNTGNPRLEYFAKRWSEEHGYTIGKEYRNKNSSQPIKWHH